MMTAQALLSTLQQNEFLYLVANQGSKKVWFAPSLPKELPVNDKEVVVLAEENSLPYGHFTPISKALSGWMSFWQHFGPRCSSATLFMSISPRRSNISAIEIVVGAHSRESSAKEAGYLHYGLDDGFITSLCAGIKKGLQSVVSHPVADVRVSITNAIVSEIESSPQSIEWLGQWLTEALLVEMCKRGIISGL